MVANRGPLPGASVSLRFGALWARQVELLQERFHLTSEAFELPETYPTDVPIVWVAPDQILPVLNFLREDAQCGYNFLADVTATDEAGGSGARFNVVYQLFSHVHLARLRVKVALSENQSVPSVVGIWCGANWAEREVFDMFGIRFEGHPDLRRILMDQRWVGYPLRKDYPLRGYQMFTDAEAVQPSLLE